MKIHQVKQGNIILNEFTCESRARDFANCKNWFDRTWDCIVVTLEREAITTQSDNYRPVMDGIV